MSIQDRCLVCAREILAGAEMKMGVESACIRSIESERTFWSGSVYHVGASMGNLLCALGNVMTVETRIGVFGLPEVGWGTAQSYGVDVERMFVILDLYGLEDLVFSAVIPAVDVMVCGRIAVSAVQNRRIAAVTRRYWTVVLSGYSWSGISHSCDMTGMAGGWSMPKAQ